MIVTADNIKKYTGDYAWSPTLNENTNLHESNYIKIDLDTDSKKVFGSFSECERQCDKLNHGRLPPEEVPKKKRDRNKVIPIASSISWLNASI